MIQKQETTGAIQPSAKAAPTGDEQLFSRMSLMHGTPGTMQRPLQASEKKKKKAAKYSSK